MLGTILQAFMDPGEGGNNGLSLTRISSHFRTIQISAICSQNLRSYYNSAHSLIQQLKQTKKHLAYKHLQPFSLYSDLCRFLTDSLKLLQFGSLQPDSTAQTNRKVLCSLHFLGSHGHAVADAATAILPSERSRLQRCDENWR
ncbi:hypothetical protein SUGI_0800620 [Cryptomeria japonica]|nr:hypothetical protein SUGI_0800620 [Cryptomeria japonica]